jgi:cell division septal protein FtsQ
MAFKGKRAKKMQKVRKVRGNKRSSSSESGFAIFKRCVSKGIRIGLLALFVPIFVFGFILLYEELLKSPYLVIAEVEVKGMKRVGESDALKEVGIVLGESIMTLDVNEARKKLVSMDYIEDAYVARRLPGSVMVRVTEREPLVLVKLVNLDELYVMDKKGYVFKPYEAADLLDLPIVTGLGYGSIEEANLDSTFKSRLFSLLHALAKRGDGFNLASVSEIHMDTVFGFSLYSLKEGTMIELGTTNFSEKLGKLSKVMRERGGSLVGIKRVDLNNERGVVVSFIDPGERKGGVS